MKSPIPFFSRLNARSNNSPFLCSGSFSPISVVPNNLNIYILKPHLSGRTLDGKYSEKNWQLESTQEENLFVIPQGLYDFIVVTNDKQQEIRVIQSEDNVKKHTFLFDKEEPFYAGQIKFDESGVIEFWNNNHKLDQQHLYLEASDIELPPYCFESIRSTNGLNR